METSLILDEVRAAFHGTELPQSTVLVNDHCDECISTYQRFWDAAGSFMTWEAAATREGAPIEASLLTPEAWRYYLPTLITWCVRDTDAVDVLLDTLVHELTPRVGRGVEWFAPRAIGFSPEQRNAICLFLTWCQLREAAERSSVGLGHLKPVDDLSPAIEFWRANV